MEILCDVTLCIKNVLTKKVNTIEIKPNANFSEVGKKPNKIPEII